MTQHPFDAIFKPRSVAVIGASDNLSGVGGPLFRNLRGSGFSGAVYPVNPKYTVVQGSRAFPAVAHLPEAPDLAVVCTPAPIVPGLVRECGERGIRGLVIVSAGFREAGAEGQELERQLRAELARFPGMRAVGPNCLGIVAPTLGLNASFAATPPRAGHVAFLSQSGALGTAVLDWAESEEIGFSYFVSVGNMADVGFGDLIDYFGRDPETHAIILYIEAITDAPAFLAAAHSFSRTKPIVAYKAGRFAASAKAATSHTGAMAGEDAIYDAAFRRTGIERVCDFEDLFDCAELLARQEPPRGARLAIVTNAGGPGVMATDALLECNGDLASLSAGTIRKLDAALPFCWSHGNPVDIVGDAPPERFEAAARTVLDDPGVDAVLVLCTPQAMTDPTEAAESIGQLGRRASKPILTSWMGGRLMQEGVRRLNRAGVPTYATPEQAVRAFEHLVSYSRHRERIQEPPPPRPEWLAPLLPRLHELLQPQGCRVLTEITSKAVLELCGLSVVRTEAARSPDEAVQRAERIGYPVVLKVHSPQITHKTDLGGVALSLTGETAVRAAFAQILLRAREGAPEARVDGVTVQPMAVFTGAIELILGARRDPVFGPVVMVGMGGVTAELLRDRSVELAPLTERQATWMVETLRCWPLLRGYRGRPEIHLPSLVAMLVRLSHLVDGCPEIQELDINPLLAHAQGAVALDARIVLGCG